jgi:hypothetical protein
MVKPTEYPEQGSSVTDTATYNLWTHSVEQEKWKVKVLNEAMKVELHVNSSSGSEAEAQTEYGVVTEEIIHSL